MKIKVIAILVFIGIVSLVGWKVTTSSTSNSDTSSTVTVQRGDVVRKAVAVGRIEVQHEVPVTSQVGGILTRRFVELGQKVQRGTPLAEVRPVITARNVVEAERSLSLAKDGEANAEEIVKGNTPVAVLTRWLNGQDNVERMERQAELNRRQSEEQLELLEQGKTEAEGRTIDFNVVAPVTGHVLEIVTREGAPVVPSSSYGSGTILVVLADLDSMLFLGTVDEIDVGRLREGMTANIQIGAVPGESLRGKVTEIGLKSKVMNNASVFDIRIALEGDVPFVLRSGYSAVAEIEVDRRDDVLVLPERLIKFTPDGAFVLKRDGSGRPTEHAVQLGLSDGLIAEVTDGLSVGDVVLERN